MRRAVLVLALVASLGVAAPTPSRAGTTILTHGFALLATQPPSWIFSMGRAILAAAGDPSGCGAIGGQAPLGTMFLYDPATGGWNLECGSTAPNGEMVLVFNWTRESDGINLGGTQGYAEAAADALCAALRDPVLPAAFAGQDLLAADVHFIGHSRGAVVNSDCVERLAAADVAVDHVTTLDPHPVDGSLDFPLGSVDWGDATPTVFTNVGFDDNYWRADNGGIGALDFDGMSVVGDIDLDLGNAIEGFGDLDPPLEHTEVHAWYHGTIDLTANDDGAGTNIDNELFTNWWGSGVPARDSAGFFHSAIVGGTRPAPVSGTAPAHDVFEIYNGDFEIVDTVTEPIGVGYAGWIHHGGDKSGTLIPWESADPPPGSTYYLTLFAGSNNRALTHNRMFVDGATTDIELSTRVFTSSPNDRFRLFLTDGVSDHQIADVTLTATTPWTGVSFTVPTSITGKTHALRLEIDGGGDGVEAVVDIDNLRFAPEPSGSLLIGTGIAGLLLIGRRRIRA
ncbi:MAG: hypothetical protein ACE5FL_05510 [Myxococcota bacterium]